MGIRLNVTFSPHIVDGKPRGYYLVVPRMFPGGVPILRKDQFVGFNAQGLVVTVARDGQWTTLTHMAVYASHVASWLGSTKIYIANKGIRIYIPGTILKPSSSVEGKTETMGTLLKQTFHGGVSDMWYVHVPAITGDVLLGRRKLCEINWK